LRRPEFIARQARHPTGILGRLLARIMAMETVTINRRVVELLELEAGSRVLEVWFGHGRTLAQTAKLAPKGFVAGIDISGTMVQMAQHHNRDAIVKGLIEIKRASSDRIPYSDESFDHVYAVHTLYFWNDPLAHLLEIHRVTRAGGRFVLAFGPKEDVHVVAAFPESVYHFYSIDETQRLISNAGFGNISMSRETIAARDIVFATGNRWGNRGEKRALYHSEP
jgi:ubiquinone/menaquinone biosynthesis C-methylase UbiE